MEAPFSLPAAEFSSRPVPETNPEFRIEDGANAKCVGGSSARSCDGVRSMLASRVAAMAAADRGALKRLVEALDM